MPSLRDFLNNPPAFLRNNHVIYKGPGPEEVGGNEHDFLLIPSTRHKARRSIAALGLSLGKADAGVFEIRACNARGLSREAQDTGEKFSAIWGGFRPGGRIQCALDGTGPGLMLTPELSGCTVAFSAQDDGTARFSHYNLMEQNPVQGQPGRQTLDVSNMVAEVHRDYGYDGRLGVLPKEVYRGKTKKAGSAGFATVIGWRRNGVWTFWAQYIEVKSAAVYQIRGVEQLQHGIRFG